MSWWRIGSIALLSSAILLAGHFELACCQDESQKNEAGSEDQAAPKTRQPLTKVRRTSGQVFVKRGNRDLLADIYQPPAGEGPFPGVLMIHGGGWMSGTRLNMLLHANALARAGYVVVNIEYRLAPAHKFPAQLDDCLDALRWMSSHADEWHINREEVALYGYSAGAHLACLMGLNIPDEPDLIRPKAIVGGGTPGDFDWIADDSMALAYFLGDSRRKVPDVYRDAAPITYVSDDDPPVFLYHGDQDSLVPFSAAQRLYDKLKANHVKCELVTLPGKGHVAAFFDPSGSKQAIQFLDSIFHEHDADTDSKRKNSSDSNGP